MEDLPAMCALTGEHVCERDSESKNVLRVYFVCVLVCLCTFKFKGPSVVGAAGLAGCRSEAFEIQKLAHCESVLLFSLLSS